MKRKNNADTGSIVVRDISHTGAQFASVLRTLGPVGFASWIIDVYGGAEPTFKPGAFFFDGANEFSAEFAEIGPELDFHEREVARAGLSAAMNVLSQKQQLHPLSVFALSRLASTLRHYSAVPQIGPLIIRVAEGNSAARMKALVVRNSLEYIVQLVFAWIHHWARRRRMARPDNETDRQIFGEIAAWSENALTNDQYRLNLVVAYAPMFFLALLDAYAFRKYANVDKQIMRYLQVLMRNFGHVPDWAGDLAVYKSEDYPGGCGVYNIDVILRTYGEFVEAIQCTQIAGDNLTSLSDRSDSQEHSTTADGYFDCGDDGDEEVFAELELQFE